MARVTYYFIVCLMVLTTEAFKTSNVPIENLQRQEVVMTVGEQCEMRGPYIGACSLIDSPSGNFECENLVCAEQRQNGGFTPYNTGTALDGTPCDSDKICIDGVCVYSPIAITGPRWFDEAGLNHHLLFDCTPEIRSFRRWLDPRE